MDMAPISASGESSVTRELPLFDDTWPRDPMINACGPRDKKLTEEKINLAWMRLKSYEDLQEEERYNIVSTELTLYIDPMHASGPTNKKLTEEKINLAWMRLKSYEDIQEEERYIVSTELTLFTDPWTIKMEMTKSTLDHLNRLILNGSFVRGHILRYLPMDDQRLVEEEGSGLTVNVYDEDTDSMHKMVLKKRPKCLSYVLLNGWRKDFVVRRALKEEDVIGMYWDPYDFKLRFCVLSRAPVTVSSASATMDSASFTPPPLPTGP